MLQRDAGAEAGMLAFRRHLLFCVVNHNKMFFGAVNPKPWGERTFLYYRKPYLLNAKPYFLSVNPTTRIWSVGEFVLRSWH